MQFIKKHLYAYKFMQLSNQSIVWQLLYMQNNPVDTGEELFFFISHVLDHLKMHVKLCDIFATKAKDFIMSIKNRNLQLN